MATTTIYSVDSTDGLITLVIQPRTFNGPDGVLRNTDLTLYGNATPNWGERFNENFYRMLENFAVEESAPGVPQDEGDLGETGLGITFPVQGQLWYNKTDDRLYLQTTPTVDLDTLPASWAGLSYQSELDALAGTVGGLGTDKVDRAGDANLTGVHSYPNLFFNEGDGDTSVGPDVRAAQSAFIAAEDHVYIEVDGGPVDGTGDFIVGKGIAGLYTVPDISELFRVRNDGLILHGVDDTTYSGLVTAAATKAIPNKKYVDDEISSAVGAINLLPPGVILPYGGTVAPTNFVLADGAAYNSVAQPIYAPLFAVFGTTYGGTGASNFNVPDMRGQTAVGIGAGSFSFLGQSLGAETHSLTGAQTGPHSHTATVSGSTDAVGNHQHGISWRDAEGGNGDNEIESWDGSQQGVTGPGGAHSHTITGASVTVNPAGSGTPHNNIQPSIGLNYIISL